jgi:hypothetical protein
VPAVIDIHYADYENTNGIAVPRHIQKIVNGHITYDITIQNVVIQ